MTATTARVGYRHPYMTDKQTRWMVDLINTRTVEGTPDRETWKAIYFGIHSRQQFETAINTLRSNPVQQGKLPEAAHEPGLYRDPSDGTLYRIGDKGAVSVYSNKSVARRLLTTGQIIKKGVWKRLSVWEASRLLSARKPGLTILAEWQMTDADKVEYVTGICNFCYRGIKDGRSVIKNYGPDCAKKYNLPWGE